MGKKITSVLWSASNLPSGLSFNTASGTFSGTPTTTGDYTVPVTVTTNYGTDTKNVRVAIFEEDYPKVGVLINSVNEALGKRFADEKGRNYNALVGDTLSAYYFYNSDEFPDMPTAGEMLSLDSTNGHLITDTIWSVGNCMLSPIYYTQKHHSKQELFCSARPLPSSFFAFQGSGLIKFPKTRKNP